MAPIRPSIVEREERGAALVEFALALPLLLVVIAGIVDFGFTFQRYEILTNAAREGARMASLPGYNDINMVDSRVRSYVAAGLGVGTGALGRAMPSGAVTLANPDIVIDLPGGGTKNVPSALVTVTYQHNFLLLGTVLGLINKTWGGTITLTATSQMRLES
jgi:Flp pilus assembly protein TadG